MLVWLIWLCYIPVTETCQWSLHSWLGTCNIDLSACAEISDIRAGCGFILVSCWIQTLTCNSRVTFLPLSFYSCREVINNSGLFLLFMAKRDNEFMSLGHTAREERRATQLNSKEVKLDLLLKIRYKTRAKKSRAPVCFNNYRKTWRRSRLKMIITDARDNNKKRCKWIPSYQ